MGRKRLVGDAIPHSFEAPAERKVHMDTEDGLLPLVSRSGTLPAALRTVSFFPPPITTSISNFSSAAPVFSQTLCSLCLHHCSPMSHAGQVDAVSERSYCHELELWYRKESSGYELIECIGEGVHGIVWRARNTFTNTVVCVKQLRRSTLTQTKGTEVKTLLRCLHPNVVRGHELFVGTDNEPYLAMDDGGKSLREALATTAYSLPQIQSILRQLLEGLEYLHNDRHIIHFDLSTANVLINDADHVKIADFGNAHTLKASSPLASAPAAALWYHAPELVLGANPRDSTEASRADMWAVGCILGEIYMRAPLFQGSNQLDQLRILQSHIGSLSEAWPEVNNLPYAGILSIDYVRSGVSSSPPSQFRSHMFDLLGAHGYDLLMSLLNFDPSRRPSATVALQHAWFQPSGSLREIEMKPASFTAASTSSSHGAGLLSSPPVPHCAPSSSRGTPPVDEMWNMPIVQSVPLLQCASNGSQTSAGGVGVGGGMVLMDAPSQGSQQRNCCMFDYDMGTSD